MPDLEQWLNPECRMNSLDLYAIRQHILTAVREQAPRFSGTLLDIGCGFMPYRSIVLSEPSKAARYIGMDLPVNRFLQENVDLVWDGTSIPLPDNSVDCSMATEFFEHCATPQKVMGEILRVLRPGGFLFLTVPFLFPLHETPHDEYRYTPFSLKRHLRDAGFVEIKLRALGGWDSALAQMIGLWVRCRVGDPVKRNLLSLMALPICRYLNGRDRPPSLLTSEKLDMQMITGLAGTAEKPLS